MLTFNPENGMSLKHAWLLHLHKFITNLFGQQGVNNDLINAAI